jgi:hypothetical protein
VRCFLVIALAGSIAAVALADGASGAGSGFRPITIRGIVLARDLRGTFFADRTGDVHQLYVNRKIAAGSRILVRGSWNGTSRFTIWANDTHSRVTILGHARGVVALGQVVLVDSTRHRFQLGAHGQIIAWVSFRPALAASLERLMFRNRTFRSRLAFGRGGRLVLKALVSAANS